MRSITSCVFGGLVALLCASSCGSSVDDDGNNSNSLTYTVTYDGNQNTGGAVPIDSNAYQDGATVTVLGNTGGLVRDGYTFAGWNRSPNGSESHYSQGATLVMTAVNLTLYAEWTLEPTYTVTYQGNESTGGTVPVDSTHYESGAMVTVLDNSGDLVRSSYTFSGWNTAADATGTAYAPGATFTMGDADVMLYATWTAVPTYTVTYNGNESTEGTVPVDGSLYEQGATVTVLGNTGNLVRTGYAFDDWNTAADGSGVTYAPGATFNIGAANVTLYAKWIVAYTVTYWGVGHTEGSAPVDSTSYPQGATVTVAEKGSLVKVVDGISLLFTGWNTVLAGDGTSYEAGDTFVMAETDVDLYAQWSVLRGTGPAGGLVFHDRGYFDGWRYMEAAPHNQATFGSTAPWGEMVAYAGADGTLVGTGKQNTLDMESASTIAGNAADLCANLNINGYDDWFLPSKDELNLMYENLCAYGVGGFEVYHSYDYYGYWYWSSSEASYDGAWQQFMSYDDANAGQQNTASKDGGLAVRAVRAF